MGPSLGRPARVRCFTAEDSLLSADSPHDPPAGSVTVRAGDPRLRLLRTLPGERQHQVPLLAERAGARADWPERPLPVPQRERAVRSGQVRASSRKVEAGPNAPQLIRLVQHPFVLETTRPRRDPERGRPARTHLSELVREPIGQALRQGLADARREPSTRPTSLHPDLRRPVRPGVAQWLGAAGREEP